MAQRLLFLCLLLTTMSLSSAHIGGIQNLEDLGTHNNFFCGRKLANVLAILCFDEGSHKRADGTGTMYNNILAPYNKEQELGWPWVTPHKIRALGLNRGKRFIVTECCDKGCSVEELMSYC